MTPNWGIFPGYKKTIRILEQNGTGEIHYASGKGLTGKSLILGYNIDLG
jgi:hypothetical protein